VRHLHIDWRRQRRVARFEHIGNPLLRLLLPVTQIYAAAALLDNRNNATFTLSGAAVAGIPLVIQGLMCAGSNLVSFTSFKDGQLAGSKDQKLRDARV
jgi:hypothetical protein